MPIPKPNVILFALVIAIISYFNGNAQELTGTQLLDNAIAYHDPYGNWNTLKASLTIQMSMPESAERITEIQLDFPARYFSTTVTKEGNTITSTLKKEECSFMLNGSSTIPKAVRDSLRINCDRAKMMRDYYTYLYGLPMKLKDPGTHIYEKVQRRSFKNKEYVVLKVDYAATIGKDTWYFYFDPKTYAMEVYQFFHEESKNDGEYILLSDMMEIHQIKIPKTRAWYYNKNDGYLATDILTEAKSSE